MIKVKNKKEISLMKSACAVAAEVIRLLSKNLKPGITTQELDREAEALIRQKGALPAFKGYRGYPATICVSVNEEVVHGIPGSRRIKNGDLVSLDVGVKLAGYFGDVAATFGVGQVAAEYQKLLQTTQEALSRGIAQARAGNHLLDISAAIQEYVESRGYSVVRKFVGHGIGSQMHEEPEIPNFGPAGEGPLLTAGMTLAIEPMVNLGGFEVQILKDQWTAVTKDRLPSAHFEHTICITKNGAEILTNWE